MSDSNNEHFDKAGNSRYDLAVVGGGIVGLATAREFLVRFPGLRLVVIEKESQIGQHQTGHNSGVIHTGIYYAPGSLKAKACVAGHDTMIDFCRENEVPFDLCGKVIVALDETEVPRLDELYRRGTVNGVQGLEVIGPERLREIEPYSAGIKAIYSPNTGTVDYGQVARKYAEHIKESGGEILTGYTVHKLISHSDYTIVQAETLGHTQLEVQARYVITCGGLYSDKLAEMGGTTNSGDKMQIVPFRGDYYVLKPEKRFMVKGMIYPVPDPEFPFLGVHFTKRINGEVWAGPNAVLAFAREGYKRSQINPKELGQALSYRGFLKLAAKYWKTGFAEMYRDYSKAAFYKALQRYMPELKPTDLAVGPSGVRAQALDTNGKLVDDFLIRQGPNVVHVQNAPSPAATSSLIIARTIADEAEKNFQMSSETKRVISLN